VIDVEPMIERELDEIIPRTLSKPDWVDVLRRSQLGDTLRLQRRPSAKRLVLYALAAVLVVYLAAPAFGLSPPFLDFFSSKPAPKRVVRSFEVLNVGAPRGMSPKVIAGQTRLVTTYHLRDGKPFRLWVAPTRAGNFCFTFEYGGGCVDRRQGTRDEAGDRNAGEIGLGRYGSHVIAGYVLDHKIDKLVLWFHDGSRADLSLTWVSAPIDAGFFLDDLTRAQRQPASAPTAIVAVDARGRQLAKNVSMFRPPPAWFDPHKVSKPADKRVILRSGRMSIAIAPARTGGNCFWLQADGQTVGSGCAPPRYQTVPMAGGLNHGTRFTAFSAEVKPVVSGVALRFQDGTEITLRPVDGHVLYDIPREHWPRGHRLTLAVAYDATGRKRARQTFDPLERGTYGCAKQVSIGKGMTACP
jgi:hypothetical protein